MYKLIVAILMSCLIGGAASAQNWQADNALSVFSEIVPNSTTAVQVCKSACRVYQIDAFNTGTSLAFVKLYDGPATCGSGTPQWRGMIPYGASSAGGGFALPWVNGDSYSTGGLWLCVTTGIADNDTGAPAANQFLVNIHFKTISQQ